MSTTTRPLASARAPGDGPAGAQSPMERLRASSRGPAGPLVLLCVGFPFWWLLGVSAILPLVVAIPLYLQLQHRRRLYLPPGFAVWALFLVWVALGVFVLWADAPTAVPGGGGINRLQVFLYWFLWYLACTVVLVWLVNSDPRVASWRLITSLLAWMFIVTAFGGLLGVLAPKLNFPSLLEALLPRALAKNAFVQTIVHPSVADIQSVLGRAEPRPTAPFAFTNSWGSNLALFLPFFVVAWVLEGRRWQRILAGPILLVALVPTVYSLNRGLWVCLIIGAVVALVALVRRGGWTRLLAVGGAAAAAVGFLASPLWELILQRLAHQHSNDRRGQLLIQTVQSTLYGSPIVGFGNTRHVQGSFASIAGASTPQCPACGVPPLGTQGHIWLVIFAQGFVGAALFLAFLVTAGLLVWRIRTRAQGVAALLLVFFVVQIYIYDTIGMPLLTLMIGLGLAAREQVQAGSVGTAKLPVWSGLTSRLRTGRRTLIAGVVLGAAFGVGISVQAPAYHSATVSILLDDSPLSLEDAVANSTSTSAAPRTPTAVTIDTEAALVFATAATSGLSIDAGDIRVTATPNTRLLNIEVRASDPDAVEAAAAALGQNYLSLRRTYLIDRRNEVVNALREQIRDFDVSSGESLARAEGTGETRERFQKRVQRVISELLLTPTNAGDIIVREPAQPVRSQPEVPITSGAALGFATAYAWALFGRPRRRHSHLRESHISHV